MNNKKSILRIIHNLPDRVELIAEDWWTGLNFCRAARPKLCLISEGRLRRVCFLSFRSEILTSNTCVALLG